MREEVSAGGVVFKKAGEKIYFLLLKDQNGNWTFPKGLVEPGEDRQKTAFREVEEETGIDKIEFFTDLEPIQYWYRWEGALIKKTVYYFLFETKVEEEFKPQVEEGISEVRWFLPEEAWKVIGYRKTNEKVLKEALAALSINSEV